MYHECVTLQRKICALTRPTHTHELSLVTSFFCDRDYITRWNCVPLECPVAVMLAVPNQFLDWYHLPDCSLQVAHSPH